MILTILVLSLVTLIIWIWRSLKERNLHWKKRGIPGPEPEILFGNLRELHYSYPLKHQTLQAWTKKFGKVFGYMDGGLPVMVISDLDMLNEILIRNFTCFHGRRTTYVDVRIDDKIAVNMINASGSRWKRIRAISAPAFSTMRLKQITPEMNSCIDNLIENVRLTSMAHGKLDFYKLFQNLTLNGISRCAIGFQPLHSENKRDDFLYLCSQAFQDTVEESWVIKCAKLFPELRIFWSTMLFKILAPFGFPMPLIKKKLKLIVKDRKGRVQNTKQKVALIDILLDCETKETDSVDRKIMFEENRLETDDKLCKKLYPQEVLAQCVLYLLAGYETTSNALSYAVYELSKNPGVQDTLRNEIFEHFGAEEAINYENVQKLKYLDCVIKETLRMYPVAAWVVTRKCMTTCKVGDYTIEKGTSIVVDVWSIHYDEEIWGENVNEFVPERFYQEDLPHPMCWIPFGAGPRRCIGDRFAMLEMKLTLVRLLKEFKLFVGPDTEVPLPLQEGFTTNPKRGVIVSFKPLE